jgi:hypothetical protein
MQADLIPEPIAHRIYDVLVRHAGATEHDRIGFVVAHTTDGGCWEFRFQGSLGFGGKFRNDAGRWRVDCYREDETPERLAVIEATNLALARMQVDSLPLAPWKRRKD